MRSDPASIFHAFLPHCNCPILVVTKTELHSIIRRRDVCEYERATPKREKHIGGWKMHEYRVDVASVKEGPFSRVQLLVIALCILRGSVDGFDNLAIAYAAPVRRGARNLKVSVLGW